ncbi:LysR family transcriptional regulator [Ferrovibrio sp.]|uniref:LysR family transcriptional regulator n=1 Tax=Ferrovibrio sp. TaxID=1917215 RepID=UPI0035122BEC
MMELSDLRVFLAVIEAGGVTRAAARLHRVQSNVTARIRKLEDSVGQPLFRRAGRRLALTPAGEQLQDYARRLLALAAEAQDALQDAAPRGLLRLGAMESTAAVRLPGPLAEFHRRHPAVQVELSTGSPRDMLGRIAAGALDAALMTEAFAGDEAAGAALARMATLPLFTEELVLVTAASHPPVRRPADLRQRSLLVFHPGCPYRQRLETWLATGGVPAERLVELGSYHVALGCVAAGMGVALMPRSVLAGVSESGVRLHRLPPPFRSATTLLVWRHDQPQAKVRALAAVLEESAGKRKGRAG